MYHQDYFSVPQAIAIFINRDVIQFELYNTM